MAKLERPRLGKGLDSLLRNNPPVEVNAPSNIDPNIIQTKSPLRRIPIGSINPNTYQPRKTMNPALLEQLAASIRTSGVMQPIVVRPGGSPGTWELVAGERRWRAAAIAGLSELPAIVAEIDDRTAAEWALVENLQREDLNPMERAWAFRGLSERFGMGQAEISERVGIDRSSVSNHVRLTELEPELQEHIASGALSMGHAKVLLSHPGGSARVDLGERVVREGWSVRRLERWVSLAESGVPGAVEPEQPAAAVAGSAALTDLERQLGDHLGTRVRIKTDATRTRGRLIIDFYNLEHFDGLMERFGFQMKG